MRGPEGIKERALSRFNSLLRMTSLWMLLSFSMDLWSMESWLVEPGVAVFYPDQYDADHAPPSMMFIETIKHQGHLPKTWSLRPTFSTTRSPYDSISFKTPEGKIPLRYRTTFTEGLAKVDFYGTGQQKGSLFYDPVHPVYPCSLFL